MLVLFHIFAALVTLVLSGLAYIRPSTKLFIGSLGLFGATFLSGVFLTVTRPVHILSVCITGLIYSAVVGSGLLAAKRRLAANTSL